MTGNDFLISIRKNTKKLHNQNKVCIFAYSIIKFNLSIQSIYMKKISLLLLALIAFVLGLTAQTEVTFDFNDYLDTGDENNRPALNGQDGWITRPHSAGNGGRYLYTGYFAYFFNNTPWQPTPDETIGVFSTCSGTSYGDIATRSIAEYGFDFSTGGIIEVE